MISCSDNPSRKLNKEDLNGIVLSLQSKCNAEVLDELKLLKETFAKLKQILLLPKMRTRCVHLNWLTLKGSAGKCPALKKRNHWNRRMTKIIFNVNVCQIFQILSCIVKKDDLDAFHLLKEKERVIVNFCCRKDCNNNNNNNDNNNNNNITFISY